MVALDVAVHGVSFAQKHAPESLLPKFRPPHDGAVNIGMLHTSLGGSPSHDRYAPCAPAELHGHGFDYWALGHIHQRLSKTGRATIVMPGNPQGRDINEAGPKSATLATIGDDRAITTRGAPDRASPSFSAVRVDLAGVEDWRAALKRIEAALGAARASAKSEHLVARVTARRRDPARLASSLATPTGWRRRPAPTAPQSARPGSTRSNSPAPSREPAAPRRRAIRSPNCAR